MTIVERWKKDKPRFRPDRSTKAARTVRLKSGGAKRDASLNPIVARVRAELIALAAEHSGVVKYDESEPRDERGEWTSGDGGSGQLVVGNPKAMTAEAARIDKLMGFPGRVLGSGQLAVASTSEREQLKATVAQNLGDALMKNPAWSSVMPMTPVPGSPSAMGMAQSTASPEQLQQLNSRYEVSETIGGWADTSGDGNPQAVAMQLAAETEFGITDAAHPWSENTERAALEGPYMPAPADQALLRGMYDQTQADLAARGVDGMYVYRGSSWDTQASAPIGAFFGREAEDGKVGPAAMQPMSSWSYAPADAWTFVFNSSTERPYDRIDATWVPADRILSTARTGYGCASEHEVVLLGGTYTTASVGWHDGELSSGQVFNRLGKLTKSAGGVAVSLDADLVNADWPKRTWDVFLPPGQIRLDPSRPSYAAAPPEYKRLVKYDESEARDDRGRWTGDGSSWSDPGPRPPYASPPDEWTQERKVAFYDAQHAARTAWDTAIGRGVALGRISPTEAIDRQWNTNARAEDIKPLPETLYHATVAADTVLREGLKTQDELRGAGVTSTGLGGGETNTISLTTDKAYADRIAAVMVEAHDAAVGKITTDDLVARATAGGFIGRLPTFYETTQGKGSYDLMQQDLTRVGAPSMMASKDAMIAAYGPADWQPEPGRSIVGSDGVERAASWLRTSTPDEQQSDRFTLYNAFLGAQGEAGKGDNPLLWTTNPKYYASVDPSQVAVVEAHPTPGAMGYYVSQAEAEWRTWTGDALNVNRLKMVVGGLVKYSEDQARDERGRWTSGGATGPNPDVVVHYAAQKWSDGWAKPIREGLWSGAAGPEYRTGATLLKAANEASPTTYPLYRGIGFNVGGGNRDAEEVSQLLDQMKPGARVDLNLAAWTRSDAVARQFASNSFGTVLPVAGFSRNQVYFEVAPGAHALDATYDIVQGPQYSEHLMAGTFEVTGVRHEDVDLGTINDSMTIDTISLKQVGLLDAEGVMGLKVEDLEKVEFFTEDGVVHPIRGSEGYDTSIGDGGSPGSSEDRPSIGPKSYLSSAKVAAVAKFINRGAAKFYAAGGRVEARVAFDDRKKARDAIWQMQHDGLRSVGANFAKMAAEGYSRTNVAYTEDGHVAGVHGYNASQLPVDERLHWGGDETYGHGVIGSTGVVPGAGSALVGAYLRDVAANDAAPVIWPVVEARGFWSNVGFAPAASGDWGISAVDAKAIAAKLDN